MTHFATLLGLAVYAVVLAAIFWPEITRALAAVLISRVAERRPPDRIIAGHNPNDPFMHRWWLIPKNRWFNVYLHHLLRDDDDRALHDHPWWNVSWLLRGAYCEVTPDRDAEHLRSVMKTLGGVYSDGPITKRHHYRAGHLKLRTPKSLHRLELRPYMHRGTLRAPDTWSLFITGPVLRQWGFMTRRGWVSAKVFNHRTVDGRSWTL